MLKKMGGEFKSILQYINSKFISLQYRLGVNRLHPKGLPFMYGSN